MNISIRQTEIYIGYEAVAAVSAALLFDREGVLVCCLFCALAHECGHLFMMLIFRCRIRRIAAGLFDLKICSDEPKSRAQDLWITSAGVLMNFSLAAVCFFFSQRLFLSNLCIGIFNLLPIESLDGGRLVLLLLSVRLSQLAAQRALKILSFICLVPFLFCGIFVLLRTGYNYSLLAAGLYLLAVLFLK